MKNKYRRRKIILIIVIVGALVAFGFWIFDIIKDKQEEDAIADLEKQFQNIIAEENTASNAIDINLTNQIENQVTPNPNPQPTENTTQPGGGNSGDRRAFRSGSAGNYSLFLCNGVRIGGTVLR